MNSYVKPANTSNKSSHLSGLDILNELDNLINSLAARGAVILCGDFNARIGLENDFIATDEHRANSFIPLPDDYIPLELPNRNSQDRKTNSYKRPFLDMLINNELHILNGRTLGDFKGEFTCIQPGGASVVDYFIISPEISELICYLTIHPLTCFSDHKPLTLTLNVSQISRSQADYKPLHETYSKAPLRYKVTSESYPGLKTSMEKQVFKDQASNILEKEAKEFTMSAYELNETITIHL